LAAAAARISGTISRHRYIPRGRNQLHTIFERHLDEFCEVYGERYAATYGTFCLGRIRDIGERFLTCGDYRLGVARIRCANPACKHDYFRPFSCKGFYLCPSCSQKRTLLFAEVSRLIYTIISAFYTAAAGKALLTRIVTAFQSYGDLLRWNSHFHSLVVEGGFDEAGTFLSVPLSGLDQMTEVFRRSLIWLLVEKELLFEEFARNLLSWRNSGFRIDNSVRLTDSKSQESLAQYIARPPLSLKKICYEPFKAKVLFHTKYSDYFGENVHLFDALDFPAELTQHVPPRRVQLIRRHGLYSLRTKGRWPKTPYVAARAPEGWRASHALEASAPEGPGFEPLDDGEEVTINARKRAWARLLAKVYDIDPLVCPKCGCEMTVIAVIQDPVEIRDILAHLVKTGRPLPASIRHC